MLIRQPLLVNSSSFSSFDLVLAGIFRDYLAIADTLVLKRFASLFVEWSSNVDAQVHASVSLDVRSLLRVMKLRFTSRRRGL